MLEALGREAEATGDRGRLGSLVCELARILEAREQPDQALGWALRWVDVAPESVVAPRSSVR